MLVQYDGPSPAVEIDVTQQTAERGTPLEVEDGVARGLLQQTTWSKAKAPQVNPTKGQDK